MASGPTETSSRWGKSSRLALAVLIMAMVFGGTKPGTAQAASSHDAEYTRRMVQLFLARSPTSEELNQATSSSLTTTQARARLVTYLANSAEWLSVSVQGLYHDTLGRPADQAGLSYWVQVLRRGALSLTSVTAHFYASSEYFSSATNNDVGTWVDALYTRLLGRHPDAAGRAYWVHQTRLLGRSRVARAFIGSIESRRAMVAKRYEAVLGRLPDARGWSYWADVLRRQSTVRLDIQLAASAESYGPLAPGEVVVPAAPLHLVEKLAGNGLTEKVITVNASSWASTTAQLTAWRRTAVGWKIDAGPWPARLGKNGFSMPLARREGAGTTPAGRYGFGTGFGLAPNPGYRLGWFVVDDRDYWVADPNHGQYNTHQRWSLHSGPLPWADAEHLIDHPVAYRYAALIRFNAPATGPYGSAIFLHVGTGGPTAGCVSVAQQNLLQLLGWIDADTRIVMGPDAVIANF